MDGSGPPVTLVGMHIEPLPAMPLERWAQRSPRLRWSLVLLLLLTLIGLAGGIAGCGGNTSDDDDGRQQQIGPPDCINHPELCQ